MEVSYQIIRKGLSAGISGQGSEIFRSNINLAVDLGLEDIKRETVKHTPVYTGALKTSIMSMRVESPVGDIVGIVSSPVPYAAAVELGTEPHWVPLAPLVLWAKRKFSLSDKAAETMAFFVQKHIAHSGTKGKFMFRQGLENSLGKLKHHFSAALARTIKQWTSIPVRIVKG